MAGYKKRGRRVRKVSRPYKKRAVKRSTGIKKIAKQVLRLKNEIKKQVEVKEYTPTSIFANTCGQVDANTSGARVFQLDAMNIPAGADSVNRVGVKVKHIGISLRFQVTQQSSASLMNRLIIDIYRTPDFSSSDASLRDQLYEVDSISGVVDANSTRNHEFIKSKFNPDGLHHLIASKSVYLPRDEFTGQLMLKDFKMFVKQNCLLHYNGPSTQVPNNYRYFVVIRAQAGNRSTSTASTLSTLPEAAVNTGVLVRFQTTSYFVDM